MTDTLSDLIRRAIELKQGSKAIALFGDTDGWEAQIGNPHGMVYLGEAMGEFIAGGDTPEAALTDLIGQLEEQAP